MSRIVLSTAGVAIGLTALAGAGGRASTGVSTRSRVGACRIVESPQRGKDGIYAVDVIDSHTVIAVGAGRTGKTDHSLVERQVRGSWLPMKTPDIGLLGDISATSRDNVWVVGARKALHWGGRRWKQVPLPNASHIHGFPVSHIAATRRGLWAHGASFVWHWNGKGWRTWASKGLTNYGGISANSDNDVWVGGNESYVDETGELHSAPVVLHWDGGAWRRIDIAGDPNLTILAVAAKNDKHVWIAGYTADETDRWIGVVEVGDGRNWHKLDQPQIEDPYGSDGQVSYTALSIADAHSAWVGGDAGGTPVTVLAREPQSLMPTSPPRLKGWINDIAAVDATTAWAVAIVARTSPPTAILRLHCG